jgi:hypothetical protein
VVGLFGAACALAIRFVRKTALGDMPPIDIDEAAIGEDRT